MYGKACKACYCVVFPDQPWERWIWQTTAAMARESWPKQQNTGACFCHGPEKAMENQVLLCLCSCSSAATAGSFSLSGTCPGWISPVCAQLSAQACPEVVLERLRLGFLLLLVMLVLVPILIIFRHYATLKCEVKAPLPLWGSVRGDLHAFLQNS